MAHIRETVDERLKRMRQLMSVNEANYSLVGGIEEDDEMPADLTEPQAEEPTPEPEEETDPIDVDMEQEMNKASDDTQMGVDVPAEPEGMEEPTPEMGMEEPPVPEEPSVEEKQNEIIKLNISAMEKMQNVINGLENTVNSLNGRIGELSADVEEVREPQNVEKLMKRKEDSHPFYYNLNDMWDGNSFQARREVDGIQGIKKMDDGTFMADFDDLPKHNSQEIDRSFNINLRESRKYTK